jgi:hypothetical protein
MDEKLGAKAILGLKLDKIAALIADETINDKELTLAEKCAVLKTLDAHYATVHKIEPAEGIGDAFNKYRNKLSTASSLRAGNSRDAGGERNSEPESDSELRIDPTSALELD